MNKTILRRTCSVLLLLLILATGLPVAAVDEGATVTLRIEGVQSTLYYGQVTAQQADATVLSLLQQVLDTEAIPYEQADGYFTTIGEDTAGAFGGWDGWVYYVNGQEATQGMGDCLLEEGDSLLVCYADPYGAEPTLLPRAAVTAEGDSYVFTFTALVNQFDESGNMTTATIPVADATVTLGTAEHTTDAEGKLTVPQSALSGSSVSVQIAKADPQGKPLAIPFAADYTLALPRQLSFSDVSQSAWYREYVLELVALGAIDGYADGTFRPTREVTLAEFIKILACLDDGFDADAITFKNYYTDVKAGDWFAPHIVWATDAGLLDKGGSLGPNINLSRQDMALIAYRYATLVMGKAMPDLSDAPAFVDEADIDEAYHEAIYFMQKAGIIEGVRTETGFAFEPKANTVRSQVSKVIVKLIQLP